MVHQVRGLGIQTMEKHRGFPVALGVRGMIESGFLKAEQTYRDLKVTMVGKKSSGGHGSWCY